ncbi:histidine kinase [Duganella sp. FT109W]|uniref:Histidine kinase n=1 Tax=Duganella margarita TaxID=2692170 RepID=A0ABW9WGV2_9BURK|nr:sensor histidine kinase [Duganella margarita]MYN40035.1 histidine kinase [Duganella margarita]
MTTARAYLLLHAAAAALCGLLSFAPLAALAQQPPARLLEQFTHTSWGALDSAPVDILSIAQTSDGWLWLAAGTGLYRFDGKRYERVDSVEGHALLSSNVRTLYAPPEGGLWVGYRIGGGISYFNRNQARHFAAGQGLPSGAITSIARGPDGVLWVAARDGLARLDGEHFVAVGADYGLPARRARQVLFDRSGRQWVAMQGGIFSRSDSRAPFAPAWPHGDLSGMALAPDGNVWASDLGSYYRLQPEAPTGDSGARPALQGSNMYFDRDGNQWIFRAGGLERRNAGGSEAQRQDLGGSLPQSFFQDREGNVWIGTSAGLNRFRHNRLLTLPLQMVFNHPAIAPVTGGGVWAGDRIGALRVLGPEGERRSVLSGHISALYRDPDGMLWAGNDEEVWSVEGGRVERYPLPPEAQSYEVQAMSRASDGGLWVSVVRAGLYLLKDGQWRRQPALPLSTPGMGDQFPTALETGSDGALWTGYIRNYIVRLAGGKVDIYTAEQGLDLGHVLTLHRSGTQLWAGGERGVAWFDGQRFATLHGLRGEIFRGVSGITHSKQGDLWLFGTEGLSRISAAQVARAMSTPGYEVEYERFDAHDGLLGAASQLRPMPSLVMADDGLLWMATANRINWINPAHIARNPVPPAVLVQDIAVGEQRYSPLPGLTLPKSTSNLRIDYTALSLSIPERVRFRYRLDGVDSDWQDPGARRQAFYTNLDPGQYRFRVMAANEDGVWNPQEAQLAFSIPPTFVETAWFKLVCAMALAALLGAAYRLRLRHVTRQLRTRLEDRADERERIARTLHDTFLQSVQGLMLRVQTLLKRLPPDGDAYQLVEKILNQADQVLAEGRNQVRGLRSVPHLDDLPHMFGELGQHLREEHAADFALIVTGQQATLTEAAREHLYHIGREALLNAFRHSGACRIELELGYAADHFTLVVRDDGRGIDEKVLAAGELPGHWGLIGMRERAMKIDAALDLWCRPGMGTVAQVSAPGSAVYERKPGTLRRWLMREAA